MDERTAFSRLRDALTSLYTTEADVYRVLDDAGIDKGRIKFDSPVNTWHKVIVEAENTDKLDSLMGVVLAEYRANEELQQAWGVFQKSRETKPVVTKTAVSKAEEIGIEWVTIPAGEFLYGKKKETVYLDEFYISKYLVTNVQYKMFVDVTGYGAPEHWENGLIPVEKWRHPVVNVSWNDAQEFCRWVGIYLPSERQWEKAARGTDGRIYPWGNEEPNERLCNFYDWVGETTPVGRYSPQGDSPYGVVDMVGNVSEWCENWFDDEPDTARIVRGGGFTLYVDARCFRQIGHGQDDRRDINGFRVVAPHLPLKTEDDGL